MTFISTRYSFLQTRVFCMNVFETFMSMLYLQTPSRISANSLIHTANIESSILHAQTQYVYMVFSRLSCDFARSLRHHRRQLNNIFHLTLFSDALVMLAQSIPIHSLPLMILSSQLYFCLLHIYSHQTQKNIIFLT